MLNSIEYLTTAPWVTCVVFTAVRLKLFSVLSDRPLTLEKVASLCGAYPERLKLLLDACIGLKLVEEHNGLYANAHFSEVYLVEGKRQYMGDLILLQQNEFNKWIHLHDMISKNKPNRQPAPDNLYQTFIRAMHNIGLSGEAIALSESVDLSGCRQMVDAGGGSGIYSVTLCRKYPQLHSILLDCKETLEVTKDLITRYAESSRIRLKEADITREAFGDNVDVVLLSDVLYDEALAPRILLSGYRCLRSGGTLLIRGYYTDPGTSNPLFGALFALNQLVHDPQRKLLTIPSLQQKLVDAGFVDIQTDALSQRSFLLTARKNAG